jgi:hypothetical protein
LNVGLADVIFVEENIVQLPLIDHFSALALVEVAFLGFAQLAKVRGIHFSRERVFKTSGASRKMLKQQHDSSDHTRNRCLKSFGGFFGIRKNRTARHIRLTLPCSRTARRRSLDAENRRFAGSLE